MRALPGASSTPSLPIRHDRALSVRELETSTWPDFFRLFAKHNGVWGGCWCTFYQRVEGWKEQLPEERREEKQRLVRAGRAHGVLVYAGDEPVGWCQFGTAEELPRVDGMRTYRPPPGDRPLWRITCFFVDAQFRRRGVARAALDGALEAIARHGGGVVEALPHDPRSRRLSSTTIWNGTLPMFERLGFVRERRCGSSRWLVRRSVAARATVPGRAGRGRSPRAGSRSSPRRSR
jgi:GNAT superfamily N-acetyltransferase